MHFLVSIQHKTCCFTYAIKAEPDGIFIAFPQTREGLKEKIFLLKTAGGWVGDADDKGLVQRLGRQIETRSASIEGEKAHPESKQSRRRKPAPRSQDR